MNDICPLCFAKEISFWLHDKMRSYFRCNQCHLIFADQQSHLCAEQELKVYQQHENHIDDHGYRRFLSKIATPMLDKLAILPEQNLQGLDFGCGPGPALAAIFSEAGYQMSIYDPYFAPNKAVLEKTYDFVTCTEAIEHFYSPHIEWHLLVNLVKEGGMLGIMTKLARDLDAFKQWHYKNDPTHVSFFSKETFCYLAKTSKLNVEFIGDDGILFTKPMKRETNDA